jgi:hypothetical protein
MGIRGLHVALALHVRRFSGFVVFESVFSRKGHGEDSNHIQDCVCHCDERGVGSMDYNNPQVRHIDIILGKTRRRTEFISTSRGRPVIEQHKSRDQRHAMQYPKI